MKKVTKKEIREILRTLDRTKIHHLAHRMGIDTNSKSAVYHFIQDNAPNNKIYNSAYKLTIMRNDDHQIRRLSSKRFNREQILRTIKIAKEEVERGYDSYSKILIKGHTNIYWASPVYEHSDYNKSRALPITEKNLKVLEAVNKYLFKKFLNLKWQSVKN